MMIPDAEPVDEQPVDEKPVDEVPTPEPEPPAPKEKMWVQLKGTDVLVEVEKDAQAVSIPIEEFEEVHPEQWENVTADEVTIVNNGHGLAWLESMNKPFAFVDSTMVWVWAGDSLQLQRRKVE